MKDNAGEQHFGAEDDGAILDGRRLRRSRTRQAIVSAVIELQEAGFAKAAAPKIAQAAGVSVRAVFDHFATQESLTLAVMEEIEGRLLRHLDERPSPGSFDERLGRFVARRSALLDKLVHYRRSGAALEPLSTEVVARQRHMRERLAREVLLVFAAELSGRKRRERTRLGQALAAICESGFWESLCRHLARDDREARAVLATAIRRLLA